jgi:hypothetical protein
MPENAKPWPALAAVALAAIGLLPLRWVLPLTPMSRDAVVWLDRSRWNHPDVLHWLFETEHFKVGYRPVTGLSYLMNHAILDAVWFVRATDFALHAGAVLLVFALVRALSPARSPWAAVLGAAVMALHPLTAVVVPHIARRGYPLATDLALLGLLALLRRSVVGDVAGLVALSAAALANEAGYVALVVGALLVASERGRDAAKALAGFAGALAALLLTRWWMIGGLGGYASGERTARASTAGLATWSTLLPFAPPGADEGALLPSTPILAAVVFVGLALLSAPLLRVSDRAERGPALMAAWLVGLTLVYLPNGVWFPRQVYLLVAPLAVLLGLLAAQPGGAREPTRWLVGVVLAAVLARSPVIHGTTPGHREAWERTDATTRRVMAAVADLPKGDPVWLVVPFTERPGAASLKAERRRAGDDPLGARIAQLWSQVELRRRQLDTAAVVYTPPEQTAPFLTVADDGSGYRIVAPGEEQSISTLDGVEPTDPRSLRLSPPAGTWLVVDDGASTVVLRR